MIATAHVLRQVAPAWYPYLAWVLNGYGAAVAAGFLVWFGVRRHNATLFRRVVFALFCLSGAVLDFNSRGLARLVPGSPSQTFLGTADTLWALSVPLLFDIGITLWLVEMYRLRPRPSDALLELVADPPTPVPDPS